jgi:threonine/homoserine/homoserine lactone efflux protein
VDYLALILFVITTCVTPGPNNIMVMTSGINHGLKKSIPHLIGINVGFPLMIILVGLGFNSIFESFPILFKVLKIISAVYLLYIAYSILTGSISSKNGLYKKPMTLLEAAFFQWVNPKAWIMALGALTAFISYESSHFMQIIVIAFIFMIFGSPCTALWLYSGVSLREIFSKKLYLKIFNTTMALLLVLSLLPVFKDIYGFL